MASKKGICELGNNPCRLREKKGRGLCTEAGNAVVQSSLVHCVKILVQDLIHGEHVDAILLEDGTHWLVAADLAFVGGVLETPFLDVFPDFLDALRT